MEKQTKAAYLTNKKERGLVVVETPYRVEFINELKKQVPYTAREWDQHNRVWKVNIKCLQLVRRLVKKHFLEPVNSVYEIEGGITTNLHTGETVEQISLFD